MNHIVSLVDGRVILTFDSLAEAEAYLAAKGSEGVEINISEVARWEYRGYVQTAIWRKKRDRALRAARYRCQVCNRQKSRGILHTHHRTYARLGHERPGDLTVLCQTCHELFHEAGITLEIE